MIQNANVWPIKIDYYEKERSIALRTTPSVWHTVTTKVQPCSMKEKESENSLIVCEK